MRLEASEHALTLPFRFKLTLAVDDGTHNAHSTHGGGHALLL